MQPTGGPISRRSFVRGAISFPLLYALPGGFARSAGTKAEQGTGLIPRQKDPENLEFPFQELKQFVTPNEQFYVRNHFPVPQLRVDGWRLRVDGAVERPLELRYADLVALPARTVTATLECACNGRAFLMPPTKGVQWQLGAVGNAEWTGVPLATVLKQAGVNAQAVDVVLEGADRGEIKTDPKPPGVISFARSLPLARALDGDVLLATKMNGADLSAAHGFPLRAIVPGWYGVASVKWLTRIRIVERPFQGFFQTFDYTYWQRLQGLPTLVPITELEVKAQIARPTANEVLPRSNEVRIHGAAWAGDSEVAKVEVSTDGGQSWAAAQLLGEPVPHAWRLWEHRWRTPGQAGRAKLMARATDQRGRTQPLERDPDRRNYMISHVLPVDIEVR
jgi:DMSO/TMAO reductase YedYZ molybdopterin-dependent catalytic subunit